MKLSVIIPFCGEFPQVIFTVQSLAQNLIENGVDFEIIAVDNWCEQARQQAYNSAKTQKEMLVNDVKQGRDIPIEDFYKMQQGIHTTFQNKSGESLKACARGNPWLKYVAYDSRLSHWQAKRTGIAQADGDVYLFLDAHVITGGIGSLFYNSQGVAGMFNKYERGHTDNDYWHKLGTFHLPLTYKVLEWHKLIYKFVIQNDYFYTYSFSGMPNIDYNEPVIPFEVPCMSTCGMMIHKDIYNSIGGWPEGLGIYGGGENFMNYTLAVTGYKKYIYPKGVCYHHGDKRDYHYEYDDFVMNRLIAHYMFGGEKLCKKLAGVLKGRPETLMKFAEKAIEQHKDHRARIKSIQKQSIEEWTLNWDPIR